MRKLNVAFTFAVFWLFLGGLTGQLDTLELDSRLVISPTTCSILTTGTTQSFLIGGSCGANIRISTDRGLTFIHEVTPEEFALGRFDFTFDTPGEYVIFCSVPDPDLVSTSAACYIVADAVPTTSEWGVMILFLSMTIVCVLVLRVKLAY